MFWNPNNNEWIIVMKPAMNQTKKKEKDTKKIWRMQIKQTKEQTQGLREEKKTWRLRAAIWETVLPTSPDDQCCLHN